MDLVAARQQVGNGLRVLMAPPQGEQAEEIDGAVARQVLAAAKGHYDLVIVDTGSVVTEASAVGMEFADDLLVVTTPDVASLRSAQDKIDLLSRLQIAKDGDARLLFNKVSPRNEVQPEFGSRVATAGGLRVAVPEDWRRLEPAVNALSPMDLEDGPFRRSIVALGNELRLAVAPPAPVAAPAAPPAPAPVEAVRGSARGGRRRAARRRDARGQVTLEAVVGLGVAVVILLVLLQTAMLALGTVVSRRAADQAALIGARGGTPAQAQSAAEHRTPDTFSVQTQRIDDNRYRAVVRAPSIVPWINRDITATGSASEEQ